MGKHLKAPWVHTQEPQGEKGCVVKADMFASSSAHTLDAHIPNTIMSRRRPRMRTYLQEDATETIKRKRRTAADVWNSHVDVVPDID